MKLRLSDGPRIKCKGFNIYLEDKADVINVISQMIKLSLGFLKEGHYGEYEIETSRYKIFLRWKIKNTFSTTVLDKTTNRRLVKGESKLGSKIIYRNLNPLLQSQNYTEYHEKFSLIREKLIEKYVKSRINKN